MTTNGKMTASDDSRNIPRALRDGTLRFGEIEVPCYVLPDGLALLTASAILVIFGVANSRHFARFVERIPLESGEIPAWPEVRFRLPDNDNVAVGYHADVVIDVCAIYTRAFAAGALRPKQMPLAMRALVIVNTCAKVGITALVWEATGYDKIKATGALQDELAATVRREAGQWERLFSPEFFSELAKLFRLKLRPGGRRPMAFAAFLAAFFYEWFERDVHTTVKAKNPRLLALGGERFERHQRDVLILMRASTSLDDFCMCFNAVFRGGGLQLSFGSN